jgi:general secretion pathway protein D
MLIRRIAPPVLCLVALAWLLPGRAVAQPTPSDGGVEDDRSLYSCGKKQKVWINLKPETELKDLVGWAMTFSCKNFVFASTIGGRGSKVTIISPKQMTPQQAWQVFLVSLQTMNLTVVPKNNVLEIVESPRAKEQPLPVYSPGRVEDTDQIVRVVLRPEHIGVDDLSMALNALKSKDGIVAPLPNYGILIVTDYGTSIDKMVDVVHEIDQPIDSERVYIIKVTHADAVELAAKLQEIFAVQIQGQPRKPTVRPAGKKKRREGDPVDAAEVEIAVPSKVIADERTNVLILLADENAYLRVSALVKYLDVAVEGGAGRIQVYYLENGDAEEMANTLNGVISGIQPAARGARQAAAAAAAPAVGTAAFEGQVRVTADKATNALVIVASVKDFLALRDVVRRLDVARRQVFIEASILEVSLDVGRRLGVSFHGGDMLEVLGDESILFSGVQHGDLASLDLSTLLASRGVLGGLIGPELPGAEQLLGVSVPSFGLLFQALATNNDVNLLSAPHIIATDNQEAQISVGQNIPYQGAFSGFGFGGQPGGQAGAGGGFSIPNVSVQRQDVALTLKITPHINASDMVRLEIDQEISDIASENFNNLGPSWTKRTLKTTVVVKDQESVVIGGLMQDKVIASESKIPLLGDLPILGYLFKYSRNTKQKTNLLVILTPYVVKDDADLQRIVARKTRERREFIETFTTFNALVYEADMDYRRKRGLVDEINRSLLTVEQEREVLQNFRDTTITYPDGPIEYRPGGAPGGAESGSDEGTDAAPSEPTAPAEPSEGAEDAAAAPAPGAGEEGAGP